MNPHSGEVVADITTLTDRSGFLPLPAELRSAAVKKLRGEKSAMLSLKSGGKLARWAAGVRKKEKNRKRNKMASKSRAKNR
jgi:hypothetical protein